MAVFMYILIALLVSTQASIDSLFERVEQEHWDRQEVAGKTSEIPAWNNIHLPNRTGTYVRYQYDMIMPKVRFERMMEDEGRKRRSAVHPADLWTRTVPYEIDDGFDFGAKYNIVIAIQHVMQHTCVVFKPRDNEKDYIKFVPSISECSSYVGKEGLEQQIKLAVYCLVKPAIAHEISHALGLYHEHMRNDRDDHVQVHTENIIEGKANQFRKMAEWEYEEYGKTYDVRSLMHYGKRYFAKCNGTEELKCNDTQKLITMEPIDTTYTDIMGNADGLSFDDIKLLNSMYQCSAGCEKKECEAGEFLGKTCECFCAGSPEDIATPCKEKVRCKLPLPVGSEDYCYWNRQTDKQINQTDDDVDHGVSVDIVYCNTSTCGKVQSTVTCNDGIWEGDVALPCIVERCTRNPSWSDEFNAIPENEYPSPNSTISHGEKIYLMCDGTNITNILTCLHGEWEDKITIPCTGDNCIVMYYPGDRFMYQQDGLPLQDNETVEHATKIEVVCRNPEGVEEVNNLTCVDGMFIGSPPLDCPRVDSLCPLIAEATVTSHPTHFRVYTVTCVDGYEKLRQDTDTKLITDTFTCDEVGQWHPSVPVCSPKKCSVPVVDSGQMYTAGSDLLLVGASIDSGTKVKLRCEHGHLPEEKDVQCNLGKWDANPLKCTKVVCGDPPVVDTGFNPFRDEHLYKDVVRVDKCLGNKEMLGETTLTCQNDGTWSGKAECANYCRDGNERWKDIRTRRFVRDGFVVRASRFKICKKKCKRQRGFLCLAISFGFDVKTRKLKCFLHRIDLSKTRNKLKQDSRWSVSQRRCL